MSKHLHLWEKLNERQQATLTAIYRTDQSVEAAEKEGWRLGSIREKASVWRNLQYYFEPTSHETLLHKLLSLAGVVDQGLGSTLQVLERHKLKEINRLFLLFNQANDKLGEVPKLMAEQSKVQQNFHAPVYGVAGNVEGDFNNYLPEQKQNLAEAAADIQKILNQLAQTNPTTDVVTEAIHQEIKRNPTLKARLISALEAGVLEGLKTFVNHPLFNIPAETIKGFLEAE